jgi:phage terminase small subunit
MLTPKQERFCLKYVELDFNGTQAVLAAGYKCNASVAKRLASENLTKPDISARIAVLRQEVDRRAAEAVERTVAGVLERRQRLTEIMRADLTDFVSEDGRAITLNKSVPNHRAASEFSVRTTYTKSGDMVITQDIKLQAQAQAIDLLNKMDKLYSDVPAGTTNNTQINIYVQTPKAEALLQRVLSGERTEKELPSGN